MTERKRGVLTIAGSDTSGGAGIQADLKTFEAFGVFGSSVVTALTAQDGRRAEVVLPVPGEAVRSQLEAVDGAVPIDAVKIGMLADAEVCEVVADRLEDWAPRPVVVDPVLAASGGRQLLSDDGLAALSARILPGATLITPNLEEAGRLLGESIAEDALEEAAGRLARTHGTVVLLKGGHLPGERVRDLLADESGVRVFERDRAPVDGVHGTGCTLASAAAAGLARGWGLERSVERAIEYVADLIVRPLRHRDAFFLDHSAARPAREE